MTSRREPGLVRLIQGGLVALVALMPLHAFLSVWLGTLLGHRALIQGWKEAVLVIVAVVAAVLVAREPARLARLRRPMVLAVAAFGAVALVVASLARPGWAVAAFGAKTDGEFLVAFVVALVVATRPLLRRLVVASLAAGAVVVAFGLLQVYALPANFLTHFGYGPSTIAPYEHLGSGVVALRFGSTLGGPNQLGTYLIILLALCVAVAWRGGLGRKRWWWRAGLVALALGAAVVLVHTYSRGAWAGAAVALVLVAVGLRGRRWGRWAIGGLVGATVALLALWPEIVRTSVFQHYFLHGASLFASQQGSDFGHLASLRSGLAAVLGHPLGHGLGTAGPTAFHVGHGQVIEDYYLQIGYETGLAGMAAFVVAVACLGRELWRRLAAEPVALALAAALAGISVNALVLPVWTDSTSAVVFWILAGVAAGSRRKEVAYVAADEV